MYHHDGFRSQHGDRSSFTSLGAVAASSVSAAVLALMLGTPALAQQITTTGAVSPLPSTPPAVSWDVPVDLRVGDGGTGNVTVSGGATLSVGQTGFIGNDAGENGTITVTGNGALWSNGGGIQIGRNGGTGSIVVSDGARLETYDGSLYMGAGGTLLITGAGTFVDFGTRTTEPADGWGNAAGYLSLDEGEVTLSAGARLQSDAGYVGNLGDNFARMLVTGQGTRWTNDISLYVGGTGNGTVGKGQLTIADGAEVTAYTSAVGVDTGSYGEVLVTGAGSTLSVSVRDGFSGKFRSGFNGSGNVVVQDGGVIDAEGGIEIATNAGSTGVISIGAEEGDAAASAGRLQSPNGVTFGAGSATLAFNHTDSSYLFDLDLVGAAGSVRHLAGTTTYTGDGSGFGGTTSVLGGTLYVNGSLGGAVLVGADGTLGGSGSVGGLFAAAGSTIRPGNSIGTLNVAGDYVQAAGATYVVELDPRSTASDRILVSGSATLTPGALLSWARGLPGAFIPNTVYTILSSDDPLTGEFTWSGSPHVSAFYGLVDSYGTNETFLTVTQHTSLEDAALTPNQQVIAALLQSLPETDAVRTAAGMTENFATARAAFDNFSGDVYGGLSSLLLGRAASGVGVVTDRLGAHEDGVWGTLSSDATWLTSDGNGGGVSMAGLDGVAGADARYGDWLGGLLVRGNLSGLGSSDRAFGGIVASGGVGAYAGATWDAASLDLTADIGAFHVEAERALAYGGLPDELDADYGGLYGALSARLAYRLDFEQVRLVPYGEASYAVVHTDEIAETGGASALAIEAFTNDALIGRLGVDLERDFDLADGSVLAARFGVGVQAVAMTAPQINGSFDSGPGFTVAGTALPETALLVSAGIERALDEGLTLGIDYSGAVGETTQSHAIKLGLTGQF